MPLLKQTESLPERSVVIGVYGEPGVSKTTICNTADAPLLIDFDRGVARSLLRKDVLLVNSWQDVIVEEQKGTFKEFKTVIIDTAKAALDDFLMVHVVEKDFKLKKNKLQAYGAIGDEFKLFLNSRRLEGCDVIIVAHAKKDEDTKRLIPDVTGQSYNLMLRVCDQIGYVSMQNNVRTIAWDPTDLTVGKNTALLPVTQIPDKDSAEINTFMSTIIGLVKKSLVRQTNAQAEAMEKADKFRKEISEVKEVSDLNLVITPVQELPKALKEQLNKLIGDKAKENKWIWNKEAKAFEAPAPPKVSDDLKKEIPGDSLTDVKEPELSFN